MTTIRVNKELEAVTRYTAFFRSLGHYPKRRNKLKDNENLGYIESIGFPSPRVAIFKYLDILREFKRTDIKEVNLSYDKESETVLIEYPQGQFRLNVFGKTQESNLL